MFGRPSEEERKAAERIGDTPEKVLRWLLCFMAADIAALSKGQWLDLQIELAFFAEYGLPGKEPGKKPAISSRGGWVPLLPPEQLKRLENKIVIMKGPTPEIATRLQMLIRTWVDALLMKYAVVFPPFSLSLRLYHPRFFVGRDMPDAKLPNNGACWVCFENAEQGFSYHAAHLLGALAGRLRRCAECSSVFAVDRRQQQFCSPKCLGRVTQRRWRERHSKKLTRKVQAKKSRRKERKAGHGKTRR